MKHDGEGNGFRVSDFQIGDLLKSDPWKTRAEVETKQLQCDCGMPGGYHLPDCEIMR